MTSDLAHHHRPAIRGRAVLAVVATGDARRSGSPRNSAPGSLRALVTPPNRRRT